MRVNITGDEKVYNEAFTNGYTNVANVSESIDVYFNSNLFIMAMRKRAAEQMQSRYSEFDDKFLLSIDTYCNIPLMDRVSEKVISELYFPIRYEEVYSKGELDEINVEIMDYKGR